MNAKKILCSKSGLGFIVGKKQLYFIFALFFLTFCFFVFAFLIASHVESFLAYADEANKLILHERFFNSPDCFAYTDPETGRTYPWVIDLEKFNEERLRNSCYSTTKDHHLAFGIFIEETDYNPRIDIKTENWRPRAFSGKTYSIILHNKTNFEEFYTGKVTVLFE